MLFQSKHPLHSIYRALLKLELKMHRNSLVSPPTHVLGGAWPIQTKTICLVILTVDFMRIRQKRFHEAEASPESGRMGRGEVNSIGL